MANKWIERAEQLGPELSEYAARHDEDGSFVAESFQALRDDGYLAALVPTELGGMGANIDEICDFIRTLAKYCPSTALAYSMHSHLMAATVWKHLHKLPGEALLRRVASEKLLLVSTGAGDWLESGGVLTKIAGGYRFSAKKAFASGSPAGDLMITSGRYEDPERGPTVLHFPLSFKAEGVRLGDDWNAHGMRGTGSHTVHIEGAFIPDEAISASRRQGAWAPAFDLICTMAFPVLMSAYVGVAERAAELALQQARSRRDDPDLPYLVGELCNQLFVVQAVSRAQVENAANFEFAPSAERSSRAAQAKTVLTEACVRTVEKAMEVAGGSAYFRNGRIEALMRDVRAAQYHPYQRMRQLRFSGRIALGFEAG